MKDWCRRGKEPTQGVPARSWRQRGQRAWPAEDPQGIVDALPQVVHLGGSLPYPVPLYVSLGVGETPRDAVAVSPCPAQAWARPGVPNDSGRGCSMGVGGQDSLEPRPDLRGHA